ncbi:MAG: hypothetical protein BWX77_00146 [Bacteroidetes bacterium ADurb.Bin090]|nr:MAG: hypothetical protein BWX77_00146 [Bacteroidetes bacterium ADurb.Bin090]
MHHPVDDFLFLQPPFLVGVIRFKLVPQAPVGDKHHITGEKLFAPIHKAAHVDVVVRNIILGSGGGQGHFLFDGGGNALNKEIAQPGIAPFLGSPFFGQGCFFVEAEIRKVQSHHKSNFAAVHILFEMGSIVVSSKKLIDRQVLIARFVQGPH